MTFWRSETLRSRIPAAQLISDYDAARVKCGAYELSMGSEAFITSQSTHVITLKPGDQIAIPPGQFALLLTNENVRVPPDAIAFISIKAGIKFRGLINVSGFHVDPGFDGYLKFSVFNAGSSNIILTRGAPTFLVWYAKLDGPTEDLYSGNNKYERICAEDVMQIQGHIASPAALNTRLKKLEGKLNLLIAIGTALIISLIGNFLLSKPPATPTVIVQPLSPGIAPDRISVPAAAQPNTPDPPPTSRPQQANDPSNNKPK